jgi:hypothetical protein
VSALIEWVPESKKGMAMESFEFLGGRYNRPEQIMSGPVQAFKAQNAANGRTVFIHRVSTKEAPEEQAGLLKLLTTALVKSADAKRMVLDFGEERGYWYVVTESEPQCALLREWLQLEIDAALGGATPAAKAPVTPPSSTAMTQNADPGEFTRFLQQRPALNSPGTASRVQRPTPVTPVNLPPAMPPTTPAGTPAVGEFTRMFQSPAQGKSSEAAAGPPAIVTPPVPPAEPVKPPPGEFTSFFNAGKEMPKEPVIARAPQVPLATDPAQQKKEPGEFTRFFTPGLPQVPPKQPGANNPYVQRPNSPPPPPPVVPVTPVKPNEPGEFTRMFSRPDQSQQADSRPVSYTPQGVRGDPMGFAKQPSNQLNDLSDNLFNDKIEVGRPLSSSQPQQSEFTKVFGAVGSEAPPIKPQGVVAPPQDKSLLDEQGTRMLPVTKPQLPAEPPAGSASGSPSEFTMIMQGGYNKAGGAAASGGTPSGAAGQSGSGSSGGSPINVNLAPLGSAVPYLGSASGSIAGVHGNVSQHGASVSSAVGSAYMSAPSLPGVKDAGAGKAAANKKLMLFFILLGVLALLMVIAVMILMKSK